MTRTLLALALTTLLVACSGGSENAQNQGGVFRELSSTLVANRQGPPQEIVVTREVLDQLTVSSLEVVAERDGRTAYLVPFSRRGPVTIWRTIDDAHVILRQGLITATRGIGNDLASSDYAETLSALAHKGGSATRRLFLRNDLDGQDQLTLNCSVQNLGPTRIEIVERTFPVHHLRETCQADSATVQNDYWIETGSGVIRQSRQWLGPKLGYMRLRVLKL